MITQTERKLIEVDIDYCYTRFNELTGRDDEFEADQDFGTSCYGIVTYRENDTDYDYRIKEMVVAKTADEYLAILDSDDNGGYGAYFSYSNIIHYLRLAGELPMEDILFNVDY